LAKVRNFEFLSGTPGHVKHFSFMWDLHYLVEIKKNGYFKAQEDANEAYLEQHNLVKQAKAHLAKIDGTTSEGTGSSKKSTKKPKETAAAASQADSALQADYMSDIKQAQKLQRRPRPRDSKLPQKCSSSTQTCCQLTPDVHGTRSSTSRWHLTPTQIYKAVPR
jgi:hypothetical protein